ncbi:TIGR02452 family protein [Paenibacillus sp. GCM10027626]|uniref:TIGR02452 family protein n=1 Tax=Paenibacillus sp. GCM10027626 TaxID=3273411 RepID=UPI003636298F
MNRKEIAQLTVRFMEQGFYEYNGRRVDFTAAQKHSEESSVLITPQEGAGIVKEWSGKQPPQRQAELTVGNMATMKVILDFAQSGLKQVGVLNFASAKNPGGGFLRGTMAQEESLAASSGLYGTLIRHEEYYQANRMFKSMMYTDHAIYSPDVVFFRDERFELIEQPVTASVLTLPAVNYGEVLKKGEDAVRACQVMKERMRLALAIFAQRGDKNLILGAYGCGVFRNDPIKVAAWWQELLAEEGYGAYFDRIVFAVLDGSKTQSCIVAFEKQFSKK